jgi:hypothetical protein
MGCEPWGAHLGDVVAQRRTHRRLVPRVKRRRKRGVEPFPTRRGVRLKELGVTAEGAVA